MCFRNLKYVQTLWKQGRYTKYTHTHTHIPTTAVEDGGAILACKCYMCLHRFQTLITFPKSPPATCFMEHHNVQHPSVIVHPCIPSLLLHFCRETLSSRYLFLHALLASLSIWLHISFIYPPPRTFFPDASDPFFRNSPIFQLRPQWWASVYSWYEVAALCVCVWNVFACLSGWWLIRRLTAILWGRPVLLWWFSGLPQIPYYTNTQECTLIKVSKLLFICSPPVTALNWRVC